MKTYILGTLAALTLSLCVTSNASADWRYRERIRFDHGRRIVYQERYWAPVIVTTPAPVIVTRRASGPRSSARRRARSSARPIKGVGARGGAATEGAGGVSSGAATTSGRAAARSSACCCSGRASASSSRWSVS